MNNQKTPQTDSIEELARFWDTHDLTDFDDELEEVSESVFEGKNETVIPIRLKPGEAEAIQRLAQARGVENETLVREWVLEKISES